MRKSMIWRGCVILGSIFGAPGASAVTVTVSPVSASLAPFVTQQFTATVSGTTHETVTWLVNGIRGGAPLIGTVSPSGLYTAPADVPAPLDVEVEAASDDAPLASGAAAVGVSASSAGGSTFYVATGGSDADPGTEASPWRTIQHAVDTVPAGATIEVASGVYNELVTITRSGSAAAGFITVEPQSGQKPVLDGTGLRIPNGQNGLFTIDDASFIRIEGFEIRNYETRNDDVPIGIYVEGAGTWIELIGNHIHDIVTKVKSSSGDALGIAIYGSSAPRALTDVVIDGNELDHLTTGYSESLSLSGNVSLWQVTNNRIHDTDNIGINIEGFFGTAPHAAYDQARNGLVAANIVYDVSSRHNPAYDDSYGADGIYVDGGTLVTIQQNLVHDSDLGIELASEVPGRATTEVIARDNLVYHSPVTGISIGGADLHENGGTKDCVIANNTFFENDTTKSGSGEFQIQFQASDNHFENNILFANDQGLLVGQQKKARVIAAVLNHNLYDSTAGGDGSQWVWLGKTYTGFASWRRHSGMDAEGAYGDPKFLSRTTPDLQLGSGSPAIDLGADLGLTGLGLVDFAGNPRLDGATVDAGAYEH